MDNEKVNEPSHNSVTDASRCTCDFCTGKKKHSDNWCARCGDVKLEPPKWWENMDVCDACEIVMLGDVDAGHTPDPL